MNWEPPIDPPEYWGPEEPDEPTLEEVEDALESAEKKTLAVLFSLSANVDGISHYELRDVRTLEDWCEEWPAWFPGVALPSREAFAPLLASIEELVEAANAVENWEEPQYQCGCRKRRCAYCGDGDY